MKLWTGHDFAARWCYDLDLQGSDPNVARDTLSQYGNHFLWNTFEIRLQVTKLWAGHDFATRSRCDLDLEGSNPNLHTTRRLNMVVISVK